MPVIKITIMGGEVLGVDKEDTDVQVEVFNFDIKDDDPAINGVDEAGHPYVKETY